MKGHAFAEVAAVALGTIFVATLSYSQTEATLDGPRSATITRQGTSAGSGNDGAEPCSHSPICAWGRGRNAVVHELRSPDLGFTYAYHFALPDGLTGGVSAVAINSKEHLFAFQRNPAGKPQLLEFDQDHKLVRTIGEEVIGHQNKAHGMAIDAQDNVWICDENGDTVMKLSPDGKLLMTLGVKGQRGIGMKPRGNDCSGSRCTWPSLRMAIFTSAWVTRTRVRMTPTNLPQIVSERPAYCI